MDTLTKETILLNAFGWWQFAVCLFAFFALMAIWWHLGRKQDDNGQVWLAVSVLCWSLSGLVEVYYSHQMIQADSLNSYKSDMGSLKSILSLCNSFFILMALPYFKYLPGKLSNIIESDLWKYIIGVPFILALTPVFAKYVFGRQYNFINDLDVYYAILTLIFLGAVLWESFAKRQLKLLSILSLICIFVTFIAQLYKPFDNTLHQLIFSAIFKSCLIMIFFALALSWIKEVIEKAYWLKNISFDPESITLRVEKNICHVGGLGDGEIHQIKLNTAPLLLLTMFIEKRKLSKIDKQWLSVKTKSSPEGRMYDTVDGAIKRLIDVLLNEIFGKGKWDKKLSDKFRHCITIRDNNKIRLNLKEENISINKTV